MNKTKIQGVCRTIFLQKRSQVTANNPICGTTVLPCTHVVLVLKTMARRGKSHTLHLWVPLACAKARARNTVCRSRRELCIKNSWLPNIPPSITSPPEEGILQEKCNRACLELTYNCNPVSQNSNTQEWCFQALNIPQKYFWNYSNSGSINHIST